MHYSVEEFMWNALIQGYCCIKENELNEVKRIFETKLELIQLISNDSVILQFIYKTNENKLNDTIRIRLYA